MGPTVLGSLELTLAGRQGEQQGGRRDLRGMSLLGPWGGTQCSRLLRN